MKTDALKTGLCASLLALALAALAPDAAGAQSKGAAPMPNAFQGFSRNSNDPVKIESDSLEVHDKERFAVFIGNVVVQQGDSTLRCRELKVFYEVPPRGGSKEGQTAAAANPEQRIRRLEASGGVIITNKEQRASADLGVFDMRTNTATITGNVVVNQGPNVMRGDKVVVDLNTGRTRMEAGSKEGSSRVQGLFVPGSMKDRKGARDKGEGAVAQPK